MTNWRKYTITEVDNTTATSWFVLHLSDYVSYKDNDRESYIYCKNIYPFSSYRKGDEVEIDLDKTQYKWFNVNIDDTSIIRIVRKASSSTNIITARGSSSDIVISPGAVNAMKSPGAMELAREMSRMVDETGKEFEFKIEDANNKRFTYSLICRIESN